MLSQVVITSSSLVRSCAVLDTNVVLGVFWFKDPNLERLSAALASGELRWHATSQMRGELCHVLQHGVLAGSPKAMQPDEAAERSRHTIAAFDRWAEVVSAPAVAPTAMPRCTDTQDQMFVDLALGMRVRWLFTRDKAVLKLRRRALSPWGCTILKPEDWR